MPLYQIVGLDVQTKEKMVYRSNDRGFILHDPNTGNALTESSSYKKYRIYAKSLDSVATDMYLAVDLWQEVAATFANVFGHSRLCWIGNMMVEPCIAEMSYSYIPEIPLIISDKENVLLDTCKLPNYKDEVDMRLYDDYDTMVFRYSNIGDNEATPNGYAHVNMNLFRQTQSSLV